MPVSFPPESSVTVEVTLPADHELFTPSSENTQPQIVPVVNLIEENPLFTYFEQVMLMLDYEIAGAAISNLLSQLNPSPGTLHYNYRNILRVSSYS